MLNIELRHEIYVPEYETRHKVHILHPLTLWMMSVTPPAECFSKNIEPIYYEAIMAPIDEGTLITAGDIYRINQKVRKIFKDPAAYTYGHQLVRNMADPVKVGRSWQPNNVPLDICDRTRIIQVLYRYFIRESIMYNNVAELKIAHAYDITNLTKVVEDAIIERLGVGLDDSMVCSNIAEKISIKDDQPQAISAGIILYGR